MPVCRILPVADSPKPPPKRITFSLPVVNAAKQVVFVALGEGKAEIVQRVLEVRINSTRLRLTPQKQIHFLWCTWATQSKPPEQLRMQSGSPALAIVLQPTSSRLNGAQ
jgi:6-phosphogluconolactonase/glucosamine-6-phosphate isomerase/deaminase